MSLTMTLNQAKLGHREYVDDCPFPPLTEEQFFANLAASEDDIKHGRVQDAYEAVEEVFAKHGY